MHLATGVSGKSIVPRARLLNLLTHPTFHGAATTTACKLLLTLRHFPPETCIREYSVTYFETVHILS